MPSAGHWSLSAKANGIRPSDFIFLTRVIRSSQVAGTV